MADNELNEKALEGGADAAKKMGYARLEPPPLNHLKFECPAGEPLGESGVYWNLDEALCRKHRKVVRRI